jgi:hypothetical protein
LWAQDYRDPCVHVVARGNAGYVGIDPNTATSTLSLTTSMTLPELTTTAGRDRSTDAREEIVGTGVGS